MLSHSPSMSRGCLQSIFCCADAGSRLVPGGSQVFLELEHQTSIYNHNIYVSILTALWPLSSRLMQWVKSLVTGVSIFRDLSLSLSCPAHCGGSSAFPFLAGLFFGLSGGLVVGLYILWISALRPPLVQSSAPSAPLSRPRRSRLSSYSLDEQ